ncbi:beta-carotene 15,15'-dioxygenase, Brp/Blh family [uncultured Pseudokineococcus sp.]|uniref:beta-carotene 15,15'-dioxygenase, Brp/Blh family n=1 Tax=uncultured Pseudokineococcus sp. TaxID=1642928 RepID=UPI0026252494|nr:beta-carotene 15,15'-dioxygenase, Brp/Blh family [uncultured Pseudokineococcus sp.]
MATTRPARPRAHGTASTAPGLPPLEGALRTAVVAVPLASAAAVAVASALSAGLAAAAGPALLVAAVVVGLPHGAVDLVQPELAARSRRGRALVGASYVGLVAMAVLALRVAPLPVLAALLVLAAAHFGLADDVVHRWRAAGGSGPRALSGALVAAARVVALGGVPVALPLALADSGVLALLDVLAGGAGAAVVTGARLALGPVAAAVLVTAVVAARRRDAVGALEPLVLVALFALAPPLAAFAAYFGLWHSLRHLTRLLAVDAVRSRAARPSPPPSPSPEHLTGEELRAAGGRFMRAAALPTGIALVGLVVLAVVAGGDVLPAALVLVLCLTVPHAVAVALADRALHRA